MNPIDRRTALVATMLASLASAAGAAAKGASGGDAKARVPAPGEHDQMPAHWVQDNHVAMLIYPKMTALDMIGPQYMFASMMGAKVHLVAKTRDPVTSDTGVTIVPTASFDEVPKDLTVLFAPGGTVGTLAAMEDEATRTFMADRGARARYVTSVCTGSLILGAAGLLEGYKATSHWATRDVLREFGATPVDARVVRDRNRITGGGVTAGLDFGLEMIAEMRDATYAQGVQLMCEYDPHPPFNSGSLHTAPADVKAMIQRSVAPFGERARSAAQALRAGRG